MWDIGDYLVDTGARATITIEGRSVNMRAWRYDVHSESGHSVPIYLLDTYLPENSAWDRSLTDSLYGGDESYRLCQEIVLGIGGVRTLRALGFTGLSRFHMNEGHAALLTLELLRERGEAEGRSDILRSDLDAVRRQCVFTTHTPVPAGHDQFNLDLVDRMLGDHKTCGIDDPICHANRLNMTYLALSLSHYINGVAKRHADITRHMFANYKIDAITNGVHAATWVAAPLASLYDRRILSWRHDNFSLRYAISVANDELWQAHQKAKEQLIEFVNRETNTGLDVDFLTLGFGRRAAAYKRADLIFEDLAQLQRISHEIGKIQFVFAGKAHPHDIDGNSLNLTQPLRTDKSLHIGAVKVCGE